MKSRILYRPSGLIGAVFGIATIIGPFIGGFLTDDFSWRWVFYVNLPFGLLALALIVSKMPRLDSGQRDPILFLPLFLVNVVGVSATAAGTSLIPQTLAIVVAAVGGSVIVQRIGRYKPILLFGLALAIVSFALLALMPPDVIRWGVTWRIMLLGFGLGCVVPFLSLIAQNAVEHRYAGSATANVQFFQQIGGVVGSVIFGAFVAALLSAQFASSVAPAVRQLPPVAQRSLDLNRLRNGSNQAASTPGQGVQQVPLATRITAVVASDWDQQRTQLIAAIRDNNSAAQAALRTNPQTPAQVKALLDPAANAGLSSTQRLAMALQTFDAAKTQALQVTQTQGQQVQTAIKRAFATSITSIYCYVIVLIAVALLVGFALPELPLRKSNTEEPAIVGATGP